jgi:hypothetical protein
MRKGLCFDKRPLSTLEDGSDAMESLGFQPKTLRETKSLALPGI